MMNIIPKGILCGVTILFLGACTKEEPEESPCGNEEVFEMDYSFTIHPEDTALLHMYYYQPDIYNVTLQFWKLYDNICTHEHIRVRQTIEVSSKHACTVLARLGLCPGIPNVEFSMGTIPLGDRVQYKSLNLNEGLKQCYDDGPGRFWMKTDFTFPKKATRQLDIQYFLDSLAPVIVHHYEFHWYKAPTP
ncbi:MAG: hypothetical protein PHP04_11920 [Bacteroidales bacterium]|nr:hypothetical protein [Bacteroidales bacterium]